MTKKNELADWISKASKKEIANLINYLNNEELGNRHGLDAFEFEYFNKVLKIFNRFLIKIPDIDKAAKIIHLIEIERQKEKLTKTEKNRKYAMKHALYNLYYYPKKINESEMKINFQLMCKFFELFFYEGGSYLRPILFKFFPQEYEAVALDIGGDQEEAINVYHTDVFPDYFKSNKLKAKYLQKLWLASHLHLSGLGDESIIKIIKTIDRNPKILTGE